MVTTARAHEGKMRLIAILILGFLIAGPAWAQDRNYPAGDIMNPMPGGWDEAVRHIFETKPWTERDKWGNPNSMGTIYVTNFDLGVGWYHTLDDDLLIFTESSLDDREIRIKDIAKREWPKVGPDFIIEDSDGNTIYKGYVYD